LGEPGEGTAWIDYLAHWLAVAGLVCFFFNFKRQR
jgi:hypothetical protein